MLFGLVLYLTFIKFETQSTKLEGYIVKGDYASMKYFPHSVFLSSICDARWICGASILNQRILLTAAHCVYNCSASSKIIASVGNVDRYKGIHMSIKHYMIHQSYEEREFVADIALLTVSTINFNSEVSRVAILETPPLNELARVAGWGLIDEIHRVGTSYLMNTTQEMMSRHRCMQILGDLPKGVLCAGGLKENSYISMGDSGSALVIRRYIQVGIVSNKVTDVSRSLVVYTDVGYYYGWITINAAKLYCLG